MRRLRTILPALLIAASAVTADAAECTLAHAIYGQPDSSTEVWFSPLAAGHDERAGNAFALRIADFGPPLAGSVGWTLPFERPSARLAIACTEAPGPEGGCTLWQGVIYAVEADGSVWLLPEEKEPPPPAIILSDLGRAIREADGTIGAFRTDEPVWDAFTFEGCAP